jgi:hypothetical protein
MDKSFNDDELSDIMKEIEALEDNFEEAEDEKLEASPVMEELAQMDEKISLPAATELKDEGQILPMSSHSNHSKPKANTQGSSSMSFKVSGDLKLDLQFEVGGNVVALHVNEHGLSIEMDGGMTFSIPLKKSA